jgi:hypothetical protein
MNSTDPVRRFLSRIENVKPSGDGWSGRCPAHDDRKNSLSVHRGQDGRVLVKCQAGAGCPVERIVAGAGLTMADLFPPREDRVRSNGHGRHIVATYDYTDESGTLLYQAVRYQPKDFKQRQPDGQGGWLYHLRGVRRVLYRLPELLAADPDAWVLVPEGEKDVERTRREGFVATCNAMGAGKWDASYSEFLRGRRVVLLPDNDQDGEAHVAKVAPALHGIAREVRVLRLPNLPPKGDVSDWFAAGATREELEHLIANAPVWTPSTDDSDGATAKPAAFLDPGPYEARPGGFVFLRETKDGFFEVRLSNFTARIAEEVIADDGASERAELLIEGALAGKPLPRVRVPAKRFASLDWVNGEWGARPIIAAGFGNRDRVREAIQRHSPDITTRRIYEHPGWRDLPGHGWCYLHAGGAIGTNGPIAGVDVALRGAAQKILLPSPPTDDDLREAVRACLHLRHVAPASIMDSLLGAVYRSVLCEMAPADLAAFLIGPTGVFKSELAALAMQHVGVAFDRLHLPAHWSATPNFLERVAFDFKDAPLVIDDFAPTGGQHEIARLHATAERVIRGAGNRGGRGRMQADGSVRPDYPPRGIVICTGEDAPRGQSLRARCVILDVEPNDVDRDRLSAAQEQARAGVYAAGLAGFIHWVAAHFSEIAARIPDELTELRREAHRAGTHARTPDAVAHLALGWIEFLAFAEDAGALSQADANEVFEDDVWPALNAAAARQTAYHASEEPARRFIDLLGSAVAANVAHIAAIDGTAPASPAGWGWQPTTVGTGEFPRTDWRSQGTRAGWVEGDDLYLDLDAALLAVQRVGQSTGNGVAVTPKTLAKRLHQRGYLRSTGSDHRELRVRRTIEGRRKRVLHLAASAISHEEPGQSGQSGPDNGECTQSCAESSPSGRVLWPDFPASTQESGQRIRPETA